MRRSFALAVPLALSLATTARAQTPPPVVSPAGGTTPTIVVTGMGEAQVVPDRARLSIGVQTQAPTAAAASARNAQLQRAVIDTLRGLGIAAAQITTSGYNVYPEQQFEPATRRTRLVGYNVQNTVLVELPRIDLVGPALDAVLSKGANLVSSFQMYSSQAEAVRRRALQNAVERARADAEAMATAAGGRIGELVELSSVAMFQDPRPMEMKVAMRAQAADAPTPVSEGTQTIAASVSARWRFVPSR